ncbi:MAG TPA: AmmeMemoRadiSam system protein B [Thermoanaerobacterales bacterium]|nr:AmmeMemoRadiSam system protein B [Thermoanaerobacterales bacterium]
MKKCFVFIIILCLGVILACYAPGTRKVYDSKTYVVYPATHPNSFFDHRYFNPNFSVKNEYPDKKIYGAVVPHHMLAHKLISEVFMLLQKNPPPLLIFLGPNHENRGNKILTSSLGWQTPFGTVEVEQKCISQLLATNLVKREDHVFTSEHSIGNLMPFVKYYLPNTKVVPIIYHHDVSKKEAAQLARHLGKLAEDGAVIIASVDFSHYLTRKEAEQKDIETLKIMEEKNLDTLFTLGNDHLDSPAALGTLFLTMECLGVNNFTLLGHTNSGILLENDLIETTSYITLLFGK